MQSNLTRALLGVLADSYPVAMNLPALAEEVHCELEALHKHLWLLHDLGAVRAHGVGASLLSASITDAGLAMLHPHTDAFELRSHEATRH